MCYVNDGKERERGYTERDRDNIDTDIDMCVHIRYLAVPG